MIAVDDEIVSHCLTAWLDLKLVSWLDRLTLIFLVL
jgi:hypothetical protein